MFRRALGLRKARPAGLPASPDAGSVLPEAAIEAKSDTVSRQEVRDEWIFASYRALFGREPDPGGLDTYRGALQHPEHDLCWLLRSLIASTEFHFTITKHRPLWPERKPVCTLIRGNRRLWVDLHDSYVSCGCLADDYEHDETTFILSQLKPGDTFLDIGANIGWFSILAADAVGDAGMVHAFEPRSLTFELLERSIHENDLGDRVVLHKTALGAAEGELRLVWPSNTVNPGGARLEIPGEQIGGNIECETVRVLRLDDVAIAQPVSLIKMDVEGAEPLVLRGGEALLDRCRPTILCEVMANGIRQLGGMETDDYLSYLRRLDYSMFALVDGTVGGEITDPAELEREYPFNTILVHRSRLMSPEELTAPTRRQERAVSE